MKPRNELLTVGRSELLSGGSDRAFRKLLHDVFAFSTGLVEARERFARFIDLTPTQYMVLIVIQTADPKAEIGISQIASEVNLSGAFITIEVNRLVEMGLVEKGPHTSDRRRVRLTVTEKGLGRLQKLAAIQRPVNDALFKSLEAAEFAQLANLMRRLTENTEQAITLADHLMSQK